MTVVCLPGDGVGPEVMREARRALEALAPDLELQEFLFGAQAIRDFGDSLPEETLDACKAADAVLKAPIGDPEERVLARCVIGLERAANAEWRVL